MRVIELIYVFYANKSMSNSKKKVTNYREVAIPFAFLIMIYIGVVTSTLLQGNYTLSQYFVEYGDSFSALLTSFTIARAFQI